METVEITVSVPSLPREVHCIDISVLDWKLDRVAPLVTEHICMAAADSEVVLLELS